MNFHLKKKKRKKDLKTRERYIQIEKEICWFTPQVFAMLDSGPGKDRNLDLSSDLPQRWQGSNYLSNHLLPPRILGRRMRELESGAGSGS